MTQGSLSNDNLAVMVLSPLVGERQREGYWHAPAASQTQFSRSRAPFGPGYEPFKELPLPEGMRGWRAPGECRAVTPRNDGALTERPPRRFSSVSRQALRPELNHGVQALRRTVVVPTVPPGTPRWGKVGNLSRAGAPLRSPHEVPVDTGPLSGADQRIVSWGQGGGDRSISRQPMARVAGGERANTAGWAPALRFASCGLRPLFRR